jgi:hypothetical protein
MLAACGQEEHVPQSTGEVVSIVINDLGFPAENAAPIETTLETDAQGVQDLQVQVQIGINRADDDPLKKICRAIVYWHRNSEEDLLQVTGGYIHAATNYAKAQEEEQFKDCFQPPS